MKRGWVVLTALLGLLILLSAAQSGCYWGPSKAKLLKHGTAPFARAAWKADPDGKMGARASMIGTVLNDYLPALTTQKQVEALLGPPNGHYVEGYYYNVTNISDGMDFWVLRCHYDYDGELDETDLVMFGF